MLASVAAEMRVEERTLRNWARAWVQLGVAGIRREPCPGGSRYVFASDFVERWLACELPAPRAA